MYFDASPWGYGAFMLLDGHPSAYLYGPWTHYDATRFGIKIGDSAGQGIWEAFSILIGMRTWRSYWQKQLSVVSIKSDSKAALGAQC